MCPVPRVMTRDEVLAQEQLSANGTVDIYDHPITGSSRRILAPPQFGGERLEPGSGAPTHGQHTWEVLESFGMSDADIQKLSSDGVVA